MKIFSTAILLLCLLGVFVSSCTSDKRPPIELDCDDIPPTWDGEVKAIIDLTCSYSGCHSGGGTGAPGNYTSYQTVAGALNSGKFQNRTFDIKDNPSLGMPPDYADGPKDLTELELNVLMCWVEAGYPEN